MIFKIVSNIADTILTSSGNVLFFEIKCEQEQPESTEKNFNLFHIKSLVFVYRNYRFWIHDSAFGQSYVTILVAVFIITIRTITKIIAYIIIVNTIIPVILAIKVARRTTTT